MRQQQPMRQPLLHLPRTVNLRVLEPKKRQHAAEDPKSRVPMLNTSPSSPKQTHKTRQTPIGRKNAFS